MKKINEETTEFKLQNDEDNNYRVNIRILQFIVENCIIFSFLSILFCRLPLISQNTRSVSVLEMSDKCHNCLNGVLSKTKVSKFFFLYRLCFLFLCPIFSVGRLFISCIIIIYLALHCKLCQCLSGERANEKER